jgi:hypothetical protein
MMKLLAAKTIFAVLFILVISRFSFATGVSADDNNQSWKFRVMLDDTPIGYHQVEISREANRKVVHTVANFDVRLFFIPVYSYSHQTRELWEDNCLVNIRSTTDDNGDDYFINSMDAESRLSVETQDGITSLDGCVRTFAYWDVELLDRDRLLNTQTGEYQNVSFKDMGLGMLAIDDRQIEARHFRLIVEDMSIDLWYTKEMHWLALESITESGAVLRYLPANLDFSGRDLSS